MAAVQPIPEGYPRVTPYLIVDGAGAAIDFYTAVLGATERMRMPAPEGKIGHAELEIGDSVIMLADEFPDMGHRARDGRRHTGVDHRLRRGRRRHLRAALEAGAKALRPSRTSSTATARVVRGPVRPPVERRHPRRGRAARRDGEAQAQQTGG